jgi:hypothetical protein
MFHPDIWNYLRWLFLGFFLVPGVEGMLAIVGAWHARYHYHTLVRKPREYIIQITTVGNEANLVRNTIATIRGYSLPFSYKIWVVNEPGHDNNYPEADRVITVPADFTCKPVQKARALEYSRRIRQSLGLNQPDVKITLLDDDSLASQDYLCLAYAGDYDICQGATVANREFGRHGLTHFILSHFDNIRVRNCMIYCSFTQGITNKPLFVHGEGLTFTVEEVVTWDHPIIASDDLVFGTRAANAGFSWGYFNAAIQIISPWTFRDAWIQRKRWTWGNISAVYSRDILPLSVAIPKGLKYVQGCTSIVISTASAVLLSVGYTHVPFQAHYVYWFSLGMWILSYWVAAWVNASGHPNRDRYYNVPMADRKGPSWWRKVSPTVKYFFWRLSQSAAGGTFMLPFTAMLPAFIIVGSILTGKPKSFRVIQKSNPATAT